MFGVAGTDWPFVAGVIYLLNTIFAVIVLFFERRNPTATLAWLMVLFFLPLIGFVLYLFLGQNYTRQRLFTLKAKDDAALRSIFEEQHQQAAACQQSYQCSHSRDLGRAIGIPAYQGIVGVKAHAIVYEFLKHPISDTGTDGGKGATDLPRIERSSPGIDSHARECSADPGLRSLNNDEIRFSFTIPNPKGRCNQLYILSPHHPQRVTINTADNSPYITCRDRPIRERSTRNAHTQGRGSARKGSITTHPSLKTARGAVVHVQGSPADKDEESRNK